MDELTPEEDDAVNRFLKRRFGPEALAEPPGATPGIRDPSVLKIDLTINHTDGTSTIVPMEIPLSPFTPKENDE